ncbi:MAG: hypothetical protein WBC33_04955 [Conexibacter sp.]
MPSATAGGLTLSDIAGIVAVFGVLLAPLLAYLRWLHRQVASLTRELDAAQARAEGLAGTAARGFAKTRAALAFEASLIERLLRGRLDEVDPDEVAALLAELQRGVERAWAEASVLSGDASSQTSALQQLGGMLGDARSAEIVRLRREAER